MGKFRGLVLMDHSMCKEWEVVCLDFVDHVFNDFSSHGLSRQTHLFMVGMMHYLDDHETLSTCYLVGRCVAFAFL